MTPYEAYQLDQERIDQQEEINFERRIFTRLLRGGERTKNRF